MSKATKRKHVTREVVEDFVEPEGNQRIVKVVCGRGNNLHEVEEAEGHQFLASMPTKFRRNVWIKRGDYIVVEPILEGNKVQAEITHILFPKQIKYLKERKLWPPQFENRRNSPEDRHQQLVHSEVTVNDESNSVEEEEDDSDLFVNPNRPPPLDVESSEDSSSEAED